MTFFNTYLATVDGELSPRPDPPSDGDNVAVDEVELEDSLTAVFEQIAGVVRVQSEQRVWRQWARCRGMDPSVFHPERPERGGRDPHGNEARAVCAACPVVARCLEHGVGQCEVLGIWGGAGDRIRTRLRPLFKRRAHDFDPDCEDPGCEWCGEVRGHLAWLEGGGGPRRSFGAGASHGIRVTYARGCRCDACRWACSAVGQRVAREGGDTRRWFGALGWLAPQNALVEVRRLRLEHRDCGELVVEKVDGLLPVALVCPRCGRFEAPGWTLCREVAA